MRTLRILWHISKSIIQAFYDVYLKYDTTILPTAVYNLQALGFTIRPPKVNIGSLPAQSNRKAEEKTYVMPLYVVPGISPEKAEICKIRHSIHLKNL